jgi:hypothetical protein
LDQIRQARDQLAFGQIAGGAEQHDDVRVDGGVLVSGAP